MSADERDGQLAEPSPIDSRPLLPPGDRSLRVEVDPASRMDGDEALVVSPDDPLAVAVRAVAPDVLRLPGGGEPDATAVLGPATRDATGMTRREVVVDGWRFLVDVRPERIARLRERAASGRATSAGGGRIEIRAVIPGRLVAISVAVGDPVEAGQQILVIEAMKMQNEVRAPHAGTVERIEVAPGQTVDLGTVLVVIS